MTERKIYRIDGDQVFTGESETIGLKDGIPIGWVECNGMVPEAGAHYWAGDCFVPHTPPPPPVRNLEEERREKMVAINTKAQELLAPYAADYPQGEVYSWPTQVAEAEAFDADPLAPTPLLSGIAAQRGTTVAHLVTRVKVKAAAYANVIGPVIGKRQYFEDLALLAATVAELDAIDITTGWPS